MATTTSKPKIIVIVGPTASGKSDLANQVALENNGEIIAADSRTVYKNMDLGTAKPTPEDQKLIKHWGIDLVEPSNKFTAYQFKTYLLDKVTDIRSRNKLPIIVGGTGLYIDSFLFDFSFRQLPNVAKRGSLEAMTIEELQEIINKKGYPMPTNYKNKRHLVGLIEAEGKQGGGQKNILDDILLVGILPSDEILHSRINKRADAVFKSGILEETAKLIKLYGKQAVLNKGGIVYKFCIQALDGLMTEQEALQKTKTAEWQYARRQRTWFRRNPNIVWFSGSKPAYKYITKTLNK